MEDQEAWVDTRRRKTQDWEWKEEYPAPVLLEGSDEVGIGREYLSSEMDQGVN